MYDKRWALTDYFKPALQQ